ncbi:hypothetical protein BC936DRAFT_140191 [Jimgerdemannia flammicorona]|uniref:Uncharacterized protein n=1 Tax=Jimgerdemannia flammicorona TaxID=994334 RepID=A0A433AXE2_9FUNG|nr:hypothetical protein BC936DRAFT_140191 [Jimgerdemannia flammicorona]
MAVLFYVLPGEFREGTVLRNGEKLLYKINGFATFIIIAGWALINFVFACNSTSSWASASLTQWSWSTSRRGISLTQSSTSPRSSPRWTSLQTALAGCSPSVTLPGCPLTTRCTPATLPPSLSTLALHYFGGFSCSTCSATTCFAPEERVQDQPRGGGCQAWPFGVSFGHCRCLGGMTSSCQPPRIRTIKPPSRPQVHPDQGRHKIHHVGLVGYRALFC